MLEGGLPCSISLMKRSDKTFVLPVPADAANTMLTAGFEAIFCISWPLCIKDSQFCVQGVYLFFIPNCKSYLKPGFAIFILLIKFRIGAIFHN
jgi:hypothetical protein